MKVIPAVALLLLLAIQLEAQQPILDWAVACPGNNDSYCEDITTDAAGNSYSTGQFRGTYDFDPGPATLNFTSAGVQDIFVQKLDVNGNLVWVKIFSGPGSMSGTSVARDNFGNIYTTGIFQGTVDFDPGPGVYNATAISASSDMYIVKLDPNGNFLWMVSQGGTNVDNANAVVCDNLGHIYITGSFIGTADFNPGPATNNLTAGPGGHNPFLQKLTDDGNYVWAKVLYGTGSAWGVGYHVVYNSILHRVCFSGGFEASVDFDPGSGTYTMTGPNNYTGFVCVLDTTGLFDWAGAFLVPGSGSVPKDICLNPTQSALIVAGTFQGTGDFDPGPGTYNMTANGGTGSYVVKLSMTGNFIFALDYGGTLGNHYTQTLAADVNYQGDIFVSGSFTNSSDFDPGPGNATLTAPNINADQIFVLRLDSAGNYLWAGQFGSLGYDHSEAISATTAGVYFTGSFQETADFDPTPAVYNLSGPIGQTNYYVARLDICTPVLSSFSVTSCGNYTLPSGSVVTSSGTYQDTISSIQGCDSIMTIQVTINSPSSQNVTAVACDTFVSPGGNLLTTSGVYIDTLVNIHGCDSIIATDLTILSSSVVVMSVSACNSFLSPEGNLYAQTGTYYDTLASSLGCDSVIQWNVQITGITTFDSIVVTSCNTYISPSGNVITTSGIFNDTIPNAAGCDSVIYIDVNLNQTIYTSINANSCGDYVSPSGNTYSISGTYTDTVASPSGCDSVFTITLNITTVDTSVTPNSGTLTANQPAAQYQWVDCNNNYQLIAGQTSQSFTPTANGTYAVIVTDKSCSDTSGCHTITDVGVAGTDLSALISVYPNPAEDYFVVNSPSHVIHTIEVVDLAGRLVHAQPVNLAGPTAVHFNAAAGTYIVKVHCENGTVTLPLVKSE